MGNEASSDYSGYRVLSVQPNSPGEEAGLDSYFDFVVAANNVQLLTEDSEFLDIIKDHEGKDLELIVYNSKRDETRACTIKPTSSMCAVSMTRGPLSGSFSLEAMTQPLRSAEKWKDPASTSSR